MAGLVLSSKFQLRVVNYEYIYVCFQSISNPLPSSFLSHIGQGAFSLGHILCHSSSGLIPSESYLGLQLRVLSRTTYGHWVLFRTTYGSLNWNLGADVKLLSLNEFSTWSLSHGVGTSEILLLDFACGYLLIFWVLVWTTYGHWVLSRTTYGYFSGNTQTSDHTVIDSQVHQYVWSVLCNPP